MEALLTREDVCKYLGISMPTLNRIMKAGKIRYFKSSPNRSGRVRFYLSDINNYLEVNKK